ncbi:ARM repeat superfamily protein [Zea mays]|uniref:ARM repeat superfamily protein n=1 Tax=Zea mays TaxID=4577 RepID=A0A1D6NYH4_MAIZE|nr:ARM repeat superfamily protein [Zea mays]
MRFHESRELKEAGSADWWRLHEASLFALGSLSEQLIWSCPYKSYNQQRDLVWFTTDILPTNFCTFCSFLSKSCVECCIIFRFPFFMSGLAFSSFCCSFTICYLAAVLLKQFIKQHWQEDEENFVPPVVSASEKVVIRQLLLTSLDDSNGKIRTAISMAVAAIGQQDWPEDWPELLPVLLKLIGDQSNGNEVRGALRCLALLSDDLDDMCVPKLVPELFPSLYRIISSPHLYENSLRAKAFAIVHSCISMLGSMSGVYKRDTASLMTSVLDPLIEQFSIVLNYPVQSQNPDDWSMQMEVLKSILPALWQTFVSSFKTYHLSYIQGAETLDSISYDSDGSEKSLESFEIQLFELWTTIVGNSRLAKVIGGNIKELAYYTIALQQITEEQVQNWSRDANQYVADEDDLTYSCRVSGSLLLEELVTAYEDYGIDSIVEASQMRFHESRELKEAGSADWWRLHEASLFALGSLSEQLCEAQDSGLTKYNVRDLLEQMLIDIMGTGVHQYPFLHARAFSSVAKFSSLISKGVSEQYLCNAAHAIASDVPPPVKVGACRALAQLLPESNQNLIQPNIMGILSSLVDLLRQAIKNAPGCLQPLVSRILPTIGSILVKPKVQPDGLVAGSLDLLTMVLKNAPVAVVKAVFDTCFVSTVQIVLESDDHGEMQNATECLAAFISGGRQELLVWGGEQGQTLKMLLDAASRLLDPALESSVSLFVGSFVLQLILQIPLHLSPHIPDLIAAIMRRMQTSSIAGLKSSLIVIIARLVHMSAPNVDGFINLLLSIPAQGYDNSLVYIMSEWSQLQGKCEIQGAYQIKVTTTALALLISTRHPELSKVEVQGHLIKTSAGITTRSKARVTPDQWTKIPLPVKIFSLLADTLTEIQEQIGAGDDDDSEEDNDWEEVQNGDASISDDIIHSASVPSMTNPSVEHLNAMAKVFDEDDDDSYDDDLTKNDPLNEVKLADFLTNIFANLWENNRPIFEYLCQGLSDSQRSAVEKVLRR